MPDPAPDTGPRVSSERAQAEALAEALENLVECRNDYPTTFQPNGTAAWRRALTAGDDALRTFRESRERTDA